MSSFQIPALPGLPGGAVRATRLAIVLLATGCGHALPSLPGFNAATWRADPYACNNQRGAQLAAIMQHKEQLYEARANDITALLGHPDEEELRAGTEKVYFYYLEAGTQCAPQRARSSAARLSLRFGPLGTVTEVLSDPLRQP